MFSGCLLSTTTNEIVLYLYTRRSSVEVWLLVDDEEIFAGCIVQVEEEDNVYLSTAAT